MLGGNCMREYENGQNRESINILTSITTTMRPLPNLCRFLDVPRFKAVDFAILVVFVHVAFGNVSEQGNGQYTYVI